MNIHFKYRENYEKLIRLDGHVKQPTINSSIIALYCISSWADL